MSRRPDGSFRAKGSFRTAGIDGARGGWVMAVTGADPTDVSELAFADRFAPLLDRCRTAGLAAVGVDMPIGFAADGHREAERLVRARLGRRASTLFAMPAYGVLEIHDWDEALARNRRVAGKGFSKQAFHLLDGSREVRAAVDPGDQPWCSEVHPESSFTAMNGGVTLESKHTIDGRRARHALVARLVASDAAVRIGESGIPAADALDAYAAAWTAARIAGAEAEVLGSGTDPDGYSLTITI